MIADELEEQLGREPFEPFRIKLVNGDMFDVFDSLTVAVVRGVVHVYQIDQNWAKFPLDKINSLESLIADYAAGPAAPEPERK